MSDVSAILSLPYLQPSQAQKHVTHNEALAILDLLVQLTVADRDRAEPPSAPAPGDRHIVGHSPLGDWAGQEGRLALFVEGQGWQFTEAQAGWSAYVLAEGLIVVFDGVEWTDYGPATEFDNLSMLGVNATADVTNRLSVSAPATLLTHEGSGHQVKVNKAGLADTASLLFQTNWSGRAEMGTAGSDAFEIKVSADGSAWFSALVCDPADGRVSLPQGAAVDGALTGSGVVGAVSESGGVSTGAVIERGSTATGEYVRFADGTQICTLRDTVASVDTAAGAVFCSADYAWTFPAAFVTAPVVSGVGGDALCWVGGAAASGTAATVRVIGAVSSATAQGFEVMAVGRWF